MNRQAMAERIAARWLERPVKIIDIQGKLINFYKAVLHNIATGHQLLRMWDQLRPSPTADALDRSYPKSLPPLKDYLRAMTAWGHRLRNNMRYFVTVEQKREQERQKALADKWARSIEILPPNLKLAKALKEFAESMPRLDQTWKLLHQNPAPNFVKENLHAELIPGFIGKLPVLKKWALQNERILTSSPVTT